MKLVTLKRRTVYLSGGMQFARNGGADWRSEFGDWCRAELRHVVIDPVKASVIMKRSLRRKGLNLRGKARVGGDWKAFFRLVVDRDVRFVARKADYLVCLWNDAARRGAGTQGELTIARWMRKPVYLVSRIPPTRLPGWVQGCMTGHFHTFEALKIFLRSRYTHSQSKGASK